MLSLNSVSKQYSDQRVLENINFRIKPGEFLSVMGKSGIGKTTMLYILAGLIRPDSGRVFFNDKDLTNMSEEELANFRLHNVGIVFQDFKVFSSLSVIDNIMLSLYPRTDISQKDKARWIHDVLAEVELSHKEKEKVGVLSGGEKQRVAIARSIVGKPAYLLADEPTGNLDSATSDTIMALFTKLHKELSTSLVIITHDSDIAKRADKIYNLTAAGIKYAGD
jgi:putative ABC transport system ATP-binding protein